MSFLNKAQIRIESQLMNKEQSAQECDATVDAIKNLSRAHKKLLLLFNGAVYWDNRTELLYAA